MTKIYMLSFAGWSVLWAQISILFASDTKLYFEFIEPAVCLQVCLLRFYVGWSSL